jgi:hydrogenase nickel incorporation protein HypA/HybF
MHESSLAISILGIVADEAQKAHVSAVTQVCLCIGDLAGVEATTLTACFEMLSEGTVADKARLVITRIPATGSCTVCGVAATGRGRMLKCPVCKTGSVKLTTGREFYVESIEVQTHCRGDEHAER